MTRTNDLVITDARVHLPDGEVVNGWLAVADGRVAALGSGPVPDATTTISAQGRDVIPGVIDIHTHFRDPGDTHKEDFSTGTLAAAFGGVTTIVDMPNTGRQVLTPADYREKLEHVAGRAWVDYGLHAQFDDSSSFIAELAGLGAAGLKWMMGYETWKGLRCRPSSYAEARDNLAEAARTGLLVGVHAESLAWMQDLQADLRAKGRSDLAAHGDSRPPYVEAIATAEAAIVAAAFGCRLHIHHLTSEIPLRTAVALREALGARLTIETCPSYLFLTHDDVEAQGIGIQVNPPMRSQADQDVMWQALNDGLVASVGSDHAPTVAEDKATENPMDALPGVVGVETMLPLMLDAALNGRITLARMIEVLCRNPAEIVRLGHRKGALLPGYDADFVIVDRAGSTRIEGRRLHSKGKFTPYEGRELDGAISAVYLRGQALVADGELLADAPRGEHAPSAYPEPARVSVPVGAVP